jgi:hypothetical protein
MGLSAVAAVVGLMTGCSSSGDGSKDSTTSTTPTTSAVPATTPASSAAPATTTAAATSDAPETGSATTNKVPGGSAGPSQTVSGGNSVAPPSVQRSPSAPTGDNLPGENGGPQGVPGAPGRHNN